MPSKIDNFFIFIAFAYPLVGLPDDERCPLDVWPLLLRLPVVLLPCDAGREGGGVYEGRDGLLLAGTGRLAGFDAGVELVRVGCVVTGVPESLVGRP